MTTDSRRRVATVRKIAIEDDPDRFDLDFWQSLPADERFAATWDAVEDLARMGRIDADQLRLRRSVVRLERRGG